MLYKLITKKLIYFNLSIIISLFLISLFFRPNLTTRTEYIFEDIFINDNLIVINEILSGEVLEDKKLKETLHINQPKIFLETYLQHLIAEKNDQVYKNCPTEITRSYFRDIKIYKFDRNSKKFSVEIKYNSLLGNAEEEVKKCFQVIFIKELNNYYFDSLYNIKKMITILIANDKNLIKQQENKNQNLIYKVEQRVNAIDYLNSIKYIINPELETKPIIKKNSVNHIIIYLLIVLFFFIIQVFYIFVKIFFNSKNKLKKNI
jgi:hypothetical protein